VNEFLESLKEEVLPGIWSKGVALARNLKSVEKISSHSEKKELKFKIQTTERILAFQVTLWPEDQDSYCNCGSKIEPCHHIVAVTLAVVGGHVQEASEEAASSGCSLSYTWTVEREKISLKRELVVNGIPQKLEGSLVSIMGGIQSGRIKLPLPKTTPQDLKIDELFASLAPPSWTQVLRVAADLPEMKVIGIPGITQLKANPKPIRETVVIEDTSDGGLSLHKIQLTPPDQSFVNGMVRHGAILSSQDLGPPFQDRTIARSQFATFLNEILPRLKDHYDLEIRAKQLPEFTESEPELYFKTEILDQMLFVTPEIRYPTLNPSDVVQKDPEKEREIMRNLRLHFGLAPKVPASMDAKEALRFHENLKKHGRASSTVDAFLGQFLNGAQVTLEEALAQKDLLLKLLLLREKRPKVKDQFNQYLALLKTSSLERGEITGYTHSLLSPILREYQRLGVAFLNERRVQFGGAILADDMGLGKTIQTLALIHGSHFALIELGKGSKAL